MTEPRRARLGIRSRRRARHRKPRRPDKWRWAVIFICAGNLALGVLELALVFKGVRVTTLALGLAGSALAVRGFWPWVVHGVPEGFPPGLLGIVTGCCLQAACSLQLAAVVL